MDYFNLLKYYLLLEKNKSLIDKKIKEIKNYNRIVDLFNEIVKFIKNNTPEEQKKHEQHKINLDEFNHHIENLSLEERNLLNYRNENINVISENMYKIIKNIENFYQILKNLEIKYIVYSNITFSDSEANDLSNFIGENENSELVFDSIKMSNIGWKYLSDSLKKNKKIFTLTFERNIIPKESCQYLFECLMESNIDSLFWDGNYIDNENWYYFSELLINNTILKNLYLYHTSIPDDGWVLLCLAISKNNSLETFYFIDNPIIESIPEKDIMKIFTDALAKNKKIKKLKFHNCILEDKMVKHLSNLLANNNNLETLILENDRISEKGFIQLINALKTNETLKDLSLENNERVGEEALECLVNTFKVNKTLEILNLIGCFSYKCFWSKYIAQILKDNNHLRYLFIYNNNANEEDLDLLIDALKSNTSLHLLEIKDHKNKITSIISKLDEIEKLLEINRNRIN